MITEKEISIVFYRECEMFCKANKMRIIKDTSFGEVASRAAKKLMPLIDQLKRDNESMNKSLREIGKKNVKEILPLRNKL